MVKWERWIPYHPYIENREPKSWRIDTTTCVQTTCVQLLRTDLMESGIVGRIYKKKTTPPSSTAERPNSTADMRFSASATRWLAATHAINRIAPTLRPEAEQGTAMPPDSEAPLRRALHRVAPRHTWHDMKIVFSPTHGMKIIVPANFWYMTSSCFIHNKLLGSLKVVAPSSYSLLPCL